MTFSFTIMTLFLMIFGSFEFAPSLSHSSKSSQNLAGPRLDFTEHYDELFECAGIFKKSNSINRKSFASNSPNSPSSSSSAKTYSPLARFVFSNIQKEFFEPVKKEFEEEEAVIFNEITVENDIKSKDNSYPNQILNPHFKMIKGKKGKYFESVPLENEANVKSSSEVPIKKKFEP